MFKKPGIILLIGLLILAVILFIPLGTGDTAETSFGQYKIQIGLVDKDGNMKELQPQHNLAAQLLSFYSDGVEYSHINYKVLAKPTGSGFTGCDFDMAGSYVTLYLYEADGDYPNSPPLSDKSHSAGTAGYPESNHADIDTWVTLVEWNVYDNYGNAYTDATDYKLIFLFQGQTRFRGTGSVTGDWETIQNNIEDIVYFSTETGEEEPTSLIVQSGPMPDNTVVLMGSGVSGGTAEKTSSNGVASFYNLEPGSYNIIISHSGYDPWQYTDYPIEGATVIGPVSLSEATVQLYTLAVSTIPYADMIDVDGQITGSNTYFETVCDPPGGVGIFLVPSGVYKITGTWESMPVHEKSMTVEITDANKLVTLNYWYIASFASYYSMSAGDMKEEYRMNNNFYLGG